MATFFWWGGGVYKDYHKDPFLHSFLARGKVRGAPCQVGSSSPVWEAVSGRASLAETKPWIYLNPESM